MISKLSIFIFCSLIFYFSQGAKLEKKESKQPKGISSNEK